MLITFSIAFTQDTIEDLYAKVLEYYSLAEEEHEKGEYIKSYEYSQLANSLFGNASIDIYMQLAAIMLNDLEKQVSASIEELGDGSSVANYNNIVNAYNAGKEMHDKFNSFTAGDDHTIIQSTFEDARDYYQAANSMLSGESNSTMTRETADSSNTKSTTSASDEALDEANTKYLYLTRNDLLDSKNSSHKELGNNIDKMNKEKSESLANENIATMNTIIMDNDIQKMLDYANKGIAKAQGMGSGVLDSQEYKNILITIDTAKSQYASKDYKAAAGSIAAALLSMESDCSIFTKLPKTYTVVKRTGSLTDSFWRISGYDFVYADREKWPTLYDNNQDKVKYKGDPRIIDPGVVFDIASIINEPREAHYNSSELYIPITVYYYLDAASLSAYENNNTDSSSSNEVAEGVNDSTVVTDNNEDQTATSNTNANTSVEDSENLINTEVNGDNSIEETTADTSSDDEGTNNDDSVVNIINEDDIDSQNSSGITVETFGFNDINEDRA